MPNLEVKCSRELENVFLENDGELLRKLHSLLKDHQSLDPLDQEQPKNTVLRNRVATTLTPWTFCIVGDEPGPSKRVSVNFALGDKPDRKGPLGDRLRKDLGLDLEDVVVNCLSEKYQMEEGRDYTMVSETREVNRHHYNDKPRKRSKPLAKNLEPDPLPDKPAFRHARRSRQHPLPREQQRRVTAVSLVRRSQSTIRPLPPGESWKSWTTISAFRARSLSPPPATAQTTHTCSTP